MYLLSLRSLFLSQVTTALLINRSKEFAVDKYASDFTVLIKSASIISILENCTGGGRRIPGIWEKLELFHRTEWHFRANNVSENHLNMI